MKKTRVLIADDSIFIRQILTDLISTAPDMEVVGTARNGHEAVQMVKDLQPDVMTLDVEMPQLNGLDALRAIMGFRPTPVIMVSTLTAAGTSTSMEALALGAMDVIAKPNNGSLTALRSIEDQLIEKLRSARYARVGHKLQAPSPITASAASTLGSTDKVVLIASSTGGPRALTTLFQGLPKGFPAPILIVQHMPAGFLTSLAERLNRLGTVPCAEAKPGSKIEPGRALFAPAGQHMKIRPGGALEFTDEPSMHGVKPAADHLFASGAMHLRDRCIGVVLTGMGRDGADGAKAIKSARGIVLSECESTCTIYGMPKAAVEAGAVMRQVPIHNMAQAIVDQLGGRLAHAS